MKKLIIALVLGMGLTGFAQNGNSNNGGNMTPEQRVERQLTTMTTDLSLDAKQQEAVSKLLKEKSVKSQEARAKMKALRDSGEQMTDDQRNAFRTAMQAENADTEAKMKTILTPDQFTKWTKIQAENQAKMRERMGNNGGGGNN